MALTDTREISNEFNNHFPLSVQNLPVILSPIAETTKGISLARFHLHPTDASEVFSLMNKLNKSKETGLDRISARLIRECADLFCVPICDIFNQSISQGKLPEDWKSARVTPFCKQGDRYDLNNNRPISVIPVVVKVFERIVYDQLYAYLEEHDILSKHQSGFRAIHSTVTALLEATHSSEYFTIIRRRRCDYR